MSTQVRLDDHVKRKVEALKRDDESFSEAIDRLIEAPSLNELGETGLSEEDVERIREVEEKAEVDTY